MNYEKLIEKLILNTKNNTQHWEAERRVPACIAITCEDFTKIFSTNITDNLKFYLIEYSYLKYFPEFDNYRPRFSIYASLVKGGIEVDGFDRSALLNSSIMETLRDLIIKKIYNPEADIENFIEG